MLTDPFNPPPGLPGPANAAAYCRQRSETYYRALDVAKASPTRATLWAAALAAWHLHVDYHFVGLVGNGRVMTDSLGSDLLCQANALASAASEANQDPRGR